MAKKFYAVKVGRVPGVYATYAHAHEQINHFPKGEMKGFNDHDEALAYISQHNVRQHASAAGSQPAGVDAEAIRDQALTAVLAAQSDTLRKEEELAGATSATDVKVKQEALIESWATVNTKAEAYADAQARVEGKEKETWYLHGCAVYTTLLSAQKFSDGKVVYKCHTQEEIMKMVADSGREFYTTHSDEFHTYENEDGEKVIKVYVDGSCLNNGTPQAVGGIGVHFGNYHHSWNVSERLTGSPQTNQRAELAALLRAFEIIDAKGNGGKYEIYTDSAYVIGCLAGWAATWEQRGWVNSDGAPVRNQDLIKALLIVKNRPSCRHVTLKKCQGHSNDYFSQGISQADMLNSQGNSEADLLAVLGSRMDTFGEKEFCGCNFCVRSSFLKTTRYLCPKSKGFVPGIPRDWAQNFP